MNNFKENEFIRTPFLVRVSEPLTYSRIIILLKLSGLEVD